MKFSLHVTLRMIRKQTPISSGKVFWSEVKWDDMIIDAKMAK